MPNAHHASDDKMHEIETDRKPKAMGAVLAMTNVVTS
jgi:hypothetical protein